MDINEETLTLLESLDPNSKEFGMLAQIDTFLDELKKEFNITEEVSTILDGEMTLFLLKKNDIKQLGENLETQLSLLLEKGNMEKIIDKMYTFLKNGNVQLSEPTQASTSAPTPSDMLARLNQTMTTPSTLAPTKRTYTTDPSATPAPSTPSAAPSSAPSGIKSIDPYREIPDK